mmetsp:Transcript_5810/g.11900  ORF Transcript_5810/g.11900 Transcript_5810/m.11900 type:complete len:125 (+) Transcript_5810:682-1056(+)
MRHFQCHHAARPLPLPPGPFICTEAVGWSHALREDARCSYKEELLLPDFATDRALGLALYFASLVSQITSGLPKIYLVKQPGDGPGLEERTKQRLLGFDRNRQGYKGKHRSMPAVFITTKIWGI